VGRKEGRRSFLKKRTKKLLSIWVSCAGDLSHICDAKVIKVFCFFFSKKKTLLSCFAKAADRGDKAAKPVAASGACFPMPSGRLG
jgi:hypothetical protein